MGGYNGIRVYLQFLWVLNLLSLRNWKDGIHFDLPELRLVPLSHSQTKPDGPWALEVSGPAALTSVVSVLFRAKHAVLAAACQESTGHFGTPNPLVSYA